MVLYTDAANQTTAPGISRSPSSSLWSNRKLSGVSSAPIARKTGPASRTRGRRRSSAPAARKATVYTASSATRQPPGRASSWLDAKISAEMTSRNAPR